MNADIVFDVESVRVSIRWVAIGGVALIGFVVWWFFFKGKNGK